MEKWKEGVKVSQYSPTWTEPLLVYQQIIFNSFYSAC